MLRIEEAENGFIACENRHHGEIGKQNAFESASSLADFIKEWGEEREAARKEKSVG